MNKLPNGWQLKTINEVCEKISAGGDRPDDCTTEKTKENQIPIFSNGVVNNGLYGYTRTPIITKPALTVSARGTIGFVCVRYEPFFPIVRLICAIPNEKILCLEFLSYALQYIIPQGEGSSVPQLTIPNFKQIEIPYPPLSEQKRIASILSQIDDYIENTIKLIEHKELFKKGISKKLLTCKEGENKPEARFKGFNDEWETVKLGDLGLITATGVDKKINDNEIPTKLLNYLDVFNKKKLYEKEISFITTATEKQLEKCDIKKGDLFITPSSEDREGIAKSSVAMEDFSNTVYSYHIIRLRFNKEIDLRFKSYMCDTEFFHRQAYRLCDGSGQRYFIKLDNFRNMEIKIPKSIEEQKKIGEFLSLLDEEIDNLKKQLEIFKNIKKGAMQKLFTKGTLK